MIEFDFIAKVQMRLSNPGNAKISKVEWTKLELHPSDNLPRHIYVDEQDTPTKEGAKAFLQVLIQGIATILLLQERNRWADPQQQYQYAGAEIARSVEQMRGQTTFAATDESIPEVEKKKKPKSTDKELVEELHARNTFGRYDKLIDMAQKKFFHDFKSPDDGPDGDKMLLVDILSQFPELQDIRQAVVNGDYDEAPDDDDTAKLAAYFFPKSPDKNEP